MQSVSALCRQEVAKAMTKIGSGASKRNKVQGLEKDRDSSRDDLTGSNVSAGSRRWREGKWRLYWPGAGQSGTMDYNWTDWPKAMELRFCVSERKLLGTSPKQVPRSSDNGKRLSDAQKVF